MAKSPSRTTSITQASGPCSLPSRALPTTRRQHARLGRYDDNKNENINDFHEKEIHSSLYLRKRFNSEGFHERRVSTLQRFNVAQPSARFVWPVCYVGRRLSGVR